jgi:hypothetical protein
MTSDGAGIQKVRVRAMCQTLSLKRGAKLRPDRCATVRNPSVCTFKIGEHPNAAAVRRRSGGDKTKRLTDECRRPARIASTDADLVTLPWPSLPDWAGAREVECRRPSRVDGVGLLE